jgi:hypothetical protein
VLTGKSGAVKRPTFIGDTGGTGGSSSGGSRGSGGSGKINLEGAEAQQLDRKRDDSAGKWVKKEVFTHKINLEGAEQQLGRGGRGGRGGQGGQGGTAHTEQTEQTDEAEAEQTEETEAEETEQLEETEEAEAEQEFDISLSAYGNIRVETMSWIQVIKKPIYTYTHINPLL